MAGIVGYGAYVPYYRIKTREIAEVWGEEPKRVEKGLGIMEKAVAGPDEDSATLAVQASKQAIWRSGIDSQKIGAVYVGSESHPYAVKPTATIVAEAIEATPNLTAADLEFACKAGTAGIQMCMGLVDSGMIKYGLSVGSDTAQGRPGDALEYSAGSGAGAHLIGPDKESVAVINDTCSFTTDTPDFWRRSKADYPSHGGRFTGKPAYFKHIRGATELMLKKTGEKFEDFDYVIFHQPNAKFPLAMAKQFGIPPEKLKDGLLTPVIGNTYSGAVMIGLCSVLDVAKPGERILATSFGSGAGSDSFILTVTDLIEERRNKAKLVKEFVDEKKYISYATYAKYRGKLKS
ncbi:hydroxymethylglutaryl-CoA synthase [Candidatus Micrarchaeota archaeon]|nr:hydroxymethylglutaryl-CoA synthase [Candidatus Micrarchaeota archaeon]